MKIVQYKSYIDETDLALFGFQDFFDSKRILMAFEDAENYTMSLEKDNEINPLDVFIEYIESKYGAKRIYFDEMIYSGIL